MEVADTPGIRGTELAEEVFRSLPATAPAAPWRLRATSLVWVAPASAAAGAALQRGIAGRANWSLPKTRATFSGHPARQRAMQARHADWEMSAQVRAIGPALALAARRAVSGPAHRAL